MLSQIFKNVYMRLDEKAVAMAQPQKMWSGILGLVRYTGSYNDGKIYTEQAR